jgi:deoxyribodipyrimidine photolyase-related protein
MKKVRLVLGDQLNQNHSWFQKVDEDVTYVMFEMRQETDYVKHHIQKVIVFFLAMRAFRDDLSAQGHQFIYYTLDDERNRHDLHQNLKQVMAECKADAWGYQLPDEYRLDQQLKDIQESESWECEVADTEHFYTSRSDFSNFFEGKSSFLMENFYRHMRKMENVLMEDDEPMGGDWNYDAENRKKFPKKEEVPETYMQSRDVTEMVAMLEEQGVDTIGTLQPEKFNWPVTRAEAEEGLQFFLHELLPKFGTYQDAMTERSDYLFHSRLSFFMNSKILSPREVVEQTEAYYREHQGEIDISNVEGFIRQILGWREYMRGIYWHEMPEYAQLNYFEQNRKLPDFYWTAETKMNCMHHAIRNSLENAYAHHIQRLMITGNFALLAGVQPDEVDAWYLGVYIDAIEWVEMPNTRGMSQFADGGIVATKPYISSANYVHKMSDYCKNCYYDRKKKVGEKACPFNSLYWNFIAKNEDKLSNNFRMGMMYRVWGRYDDETQLDILNQAEKYLHQINEL